MKKLAIAAIIAAVFSANAFAVEVTDSDVGRWNEAANNVQQGYIDYALDTNNRQQETIDHHSKEIANNREAIKSLNKNFADLKDKVDDNRKKAAAGIAGVAAMAGMPQVEQGKRFMLSAGVGGYDGEQAVAVGFSTRLTHNVVAKAGVSATTQSEVVWSAGAGVSW